MSEQVLKHGIHLNVPFAEYLRWPILSQSTLKEMRNSPAHFRAAMDGERAKVPTDDMILGSALHVAFLEPELAAEKIVVWNGGRRYGAEWDGFRDDHSEQIILTPNQHQKMVGMVRSLRQHREVRQWLSKIEQTEVSCVGLVHGYDFKGRCDALTSDPLIDLKMTNNTGPVSFTKRVIDFGYDIQGYSYGQLFDRDRFILMAIEKDPPHDVVPYELSPAFLRRAQAEVTRLLDQLLECEQAGKWPGRADWPVMLELPDWAVPDDAGSAITIGGEAAFVEG